MILCFGFPIAITLASLMAWGVGWLRHMQISQLAAGLAPIYFAPGLVFLLSAASWVLLAIPGLVLAALLLTFSLKIITSAWSNRVLLRFLISCAVVLVRWLLLLSAHDKNAEGRAWNFFLIFLETTGTHLRTRSDGSAAFDNCFD